LCFSCYKPGDKSWKRKGPDCDYDKRNISVVICGTDIPSNSSIFLRTLYTVL
jgi:hypothetical protein